jgi:hypothetical protein
LKKSLSLHTTTAKAREEEYKKKETTTKVLRHIHRHLSKRAICAQRKEEKNNFVYYNELTESTSENLSLGGRTSV